MGQEQFKNQKKVKISSWLNLLFVMLQEESEDFKIFGCVGCPLVVEHNHC